MASRLEGLPAAAAAYRLRLEDGRRRGLAVARRQAVEGARQAGHAAGESSALRRLAAEYEASGLGDDALRGRVAAGIEGALAAFGEIARLPGAGLPAVRPATPMGWARSATPAWPAGSSARRPTSGRSTPGAGRRSPACCAAWRKPPPPSSPGRRAARCCACCRRTRRGRLPRPRSSAP